MTTLTTVLARADVSVPNDLLADIEVPVLTEQRQGDVALFLRGPASDVEVSEMTAVPAAGFPVVRGETTGGNTHLLQPEPGCEVFYKQHVPTHAGDVLLGVLHVPAGAVAWLIHTDEHGANGIAPGTYTMKGKREQADEQRRVAD